MQGKAAARRRWFHRAALALCAALCALIVPLAPGSVAHADSTRELLGNDPALAFVDRLPPYQPRERVSGLIRVWGHGSFKRDFMGKLLANWVAEFGRHQPGVAFENRMYGTASAIGALYTGAGDIAILGEEISPAALRAFRRARGYDPTGIEIATGSVDVNYYDYAHMVFVNAGNPVRGLSLPQLAAIFGESGAKHDIRDWSQLGGVRGGSGGGSDGIIQPYGWRTDVDFALFFRERVLAGNHRWNGAMQEFEHEKGADGSQYDHGQRILDALAKDPDGIAISNVRYARPGVRALPLSWKPGGPYVSASPATLIDRSYPLVRIIPAYVDVPPGQRMAPAQREFLRFLLSREGQRILIENSGYLPMGTRFIARETAKLR